MLLSRQALQENAKNVSAHNFCNVVGGESLREQGLGDQREAGGIKGRGDGAVEVRAQADVIDPGYAHGISNGAGDRRSIRAAHGRVPVADADDAAGARDAAQFVVAQVAPIVTGAFDAGVRHDHGTRGHGKRAGDGLRRGVREIENHFARFHAAEHFPALFREATFFDAVRGAGEIIVEKMSGGHHAETGVEEDVNIVKITVESMRALDTQKSGGDAGVALAQLEVLV